MNILKVRNLFQRALFELELKAQMSDGHWSTAGPKEHWKPWCEAEVIVADRGTPVGPNFQAKRTTYCFSSPELLKKVGNRCMVYARLATLVQDLNDVNTLEECFDSQTGEWTGLSKFQSEDSAEKQEKVLNLFAEYGENAIRNRGLDDSIYDRVDLGRDCRDLANILRISPPETIIVNETTIPPVVEPVPVAA